MENQNIKGVSCCRGEEAASRERRALIFLKDYYLMIQACQLGYVYTIFTHKFEMVSCGLLLQTDMQLHEAVDFLISFVQKADEPCEPIEFQKFIQDMQLTTGGYPRFLYDDRQLAGKTCMFVSRRGDRKCMKYDGALCRIIRRVDESALDFLDKGSYWLAEMPDGQCIEVSANEVSLARTPQEFEMYMRTK